MSFIEINFAFYDKLPMKYKKGITMDTQYNIGDIFFVTLEHYNSVMLNTLQNNPILQHNIAIFRLDGVAGSHAFRPFMNSRADRAFLDAATLFSFSKNERIKALGELCSLLHGLNAIIPSGDLVNSHDDILVSLSHNHLTKIVEATSGHKIKSVDKLIETMSALNTSSEEYGYLLNVVAHNILKTWSLCGEANSSTKLDKSFGETHVNILIVPERPSKERLAETLEDPLIPAMKAWIQTHSKRCNLPFLVHISDDLQSRLEEVNLPKFEEPKKLA